MQNIMVIYEGKVYELDSLGKLLDWTVSRMVKREETPSPKAEVPPKEDKGISSKGQEALNKILETPAKEPVKVPNSMDLPPMKKPFFGGKDKGEMLSFSYEINGQTARKSPADCSRILFTKTRAFADMPKKEQDKVITWGLSFLKKQVRETGKPATCDTYMLVPYSHDKFSFLAGAKVQFKVSLKKA